MNQLIDYLKTRRSVPAAFLQNPTPTDDELRMILTIACRVPDHGKLARWRFVIFSPQKGAALGEQLFELAVQTTLEPAKAEQEKSRFTRAPLTVMLVSTAAQDAKIPVWEQQLAAGCVGMNLLHGVYALGYKAQWVTGFAAYNAKAKALLGVAEHEQVVGFFHIGSCDMEITDRERPDLSALICDKR